MEQLLLTSIPFERIISEITEAVKGELQPLLTETKQSSKALSEYKTRKETAARLGISLPTLNAWTKNGLITAYRIGGSSIRYKENEIETALVKIQSSRRSA